MLAVSVLNNINNLISKALSTALVERLDILMETSAAGVRNELVSVCDELLRQNLTDKHTYKIMMLQL